MKDLPGVSTHFDAFLTSASGQSSSHAKVVATAQFSFAAGCTVAVAGVGSDENLNFACSFSI